MRGGAWRRARRRRRARSWPARAARPGRRVRLLAGRGVPLRAAAATSALMIGVTATAGAVIYYGRGQIVPVLAAAAVLGVQVGSRGGMRFGQRASSWWLKILMAGILIVVSVLMFVRAAH